MYKNFKLTITDFPPLACKRQMFLFFSWSADFFAHLYCFFFSNSVLLTLNRMLLLRGFAVYLSQHQKRTEMFKSVKTKIVKLKDEIKYINLKHV